MWPTILHALTAELAIATALTGEPVSAAATAAAGVASLAVREVGD